MTVLTKVCSHLAPSRPHSFTKARTQGTPHRCSMTFRVGQPFQADVRLESLTYVADLTTKSDPASGVPPGSKGGSKSGKDHPFLAAGKRGWPFPSRICHPPYAIRHLSSAIRHLPSAIRHLPSGICHLPSGGELSICHRVLRLAGFHRPRRTGQCPWSMPRAEPVTALPTRQGVNMLRKATFSGRGRSFASLVFDAS